MYRTFADVVTKNDLDTQAKEAGERPLTPPVKNGKPFNDVVERSDDQSQYMEKIIYRMEHLPKDPREDNPLKITNDARKAGLDYRLIDSAAVDFEGTKVNAAVERIYQIWQDTASDKGTQLVFCDLSTPKSSKGFAPSVKRDVELAQEKSGGIIGGIIEDSQSRDESDTASESENDPDEMSEIIDMDSIVAMGSGNFSVYDDMKSKLVAKGIPADEIAFIHDANTDLRKSKLFSDMNSGHIRILFGSTAKMGAGMNVQKRLVAAHHLDAPWRPSDLEQRNGRIIRQGNMFYERDPDNFCVEIYNYATKQTYDARMWQTIEYKAAAIEQFRKGDLLQRVIDDVASEAANAAEMKAAASGNPLILIQVQLASELQKLEALYSQHQRSQFRLRDSLKWLNGADERLAKAEASYTENCRLRDANTKIIKEKDKEKIAVELLVEGETLRAKDGNKMQDRLLSGIKEVTRNAGASVLFGRYRGFEVYINRVTSLLGGDDGFRLTLKGADDQQFKPMNLIYSFNDKLSLAGMFQRMDNFLAKGFDEVIIAQREQASKEKAELATVNTALGKEFPQKAELELVRQNHSDVMRELQRMQNEPGYVSEWQPKTLDASEKANETEKPINDNAAAAESSPDEKPKAYWQKLEYEKDGGKIEYSVTNQHNGYTLDGYVLRQTRFDSYVGSLGQSLYEDGQWHTTATVPAGVNLKQFVSPDDALVFAHADARERGLESAIPTGPVEKEPICSFSEKEQNDPIVAAGFTPLGRDCLGWEEYKLKVREEDGGTYSIRLSRAGEEVAVNVQYEKDNIVDARRTVKGNFDKVESALAFVKEYSVSAEELNNKDVKSRKRLSCG